MSTNGQVEGKVSGSKREKFRGYLRAANELRQSYKSTLTQRLQGGDDDNDMPGSFPEVEIVRSGYEEMLLFPSYARTRVKKPKANQSSASRSIPGTSENIERPQSTGDAAYWMSEWQRYEDENAVVDVDVRGWIYTPQRGQLSRKNRLLVAVARRLSGIPAPSSSPVASRGTSPQPINRVRTDDKPTILEEEVAAKEADHIARHGQKEAEVAARGSYSSKTLAESPGISRSSSPSRIHDTLGRNSSFTDSELASEDEDPGRRSIAKRLSWNTATNMSREELIKANDMLMTRLRPFLSIPLSNTTITVFFFNDQKSQSKTVTTNDSGHFNVRAALDFVPTSVRVLASENLSLTDEVLITESKGISLISDVDDTIKHSAISSGAREIFKNTFVRDLGELTIKGVKEWYTQVAGMGVKLHYVSNSPWQLYPLLRSYFSLAGLPPGSFHLKQYTGMLQGIFEPAAERKKGSLERIMNDFPDRKFILVGDSGEADLEVYTDIVLSYPRRILAVFIRDVTTPVRKKFFDGSAPNSPPSSPPTSPPGSPIFSMLTGSRGRTRDAAEKRPQLPARATADHGVKESNQESELLIDFTDEPSPIDLGKPSLYNEDLRQLSDSERNSKGLQPPGKPAKPSNLRNIATQSPSNSTDKLPAKQGIENETSKKQPPPPPPKRRQGPATVETIDTSTTADKNDSSTLRQNEKKPQDSATASSHAKPTRPRAVHSYNSTSAIPTFSLNDEIGYAASARRQLTTASTMRATSPSRQDGGRTPPLPPRRGLTSTATRWVTGATGGDPSAGGDGGVPGMSYSKKEEMWRRRWDRAEFIMANRGVTLRMWRVGSDVMDDCIKIIEKAMKDMEDNPKT